MTDTMRPLPVDCSALLHGEPRLTTSSRLRLYLPLTPLAFTSTQSGKLHPCMTRIDRSRLVLWSQSSQVIQSYGSPSAAYGLMFLGAHFVWAFSLMFLFSGRGYWQAIIWAHKVVVAAHVLVGFPTHMRAGLHPAINGISTGRTGLGPWHQTAINASNVSANLGYKFGFGVQFGQYVCTSSGSWRHHGSYIQAMDLSAALGQATDNSIGDARA